MNSRGASVGGMGWRRIKGIEERNSEDKNIENPVGGYRQDGNHELGKEKKVNNAMVAKPTSPHRYKLTPRNGKYSKGRSQKS